MRKTLKIIYYFLVGMTCWFDVQAQTYKQDLLAINKKMLSINSYSMNLKYNLYLDNNFKKPYQSRSIVINRNGNHIFLKQSTGIDVLDNDDYQIMINSSSKSIVVRRKAKEENMFEQRAELFGYINTNIDSVIRHFDKINKLSELGDLASYELLYKPNDQIVKTIATINKKTNTFHSVKVYYKNYYAPEKLDDKYHEVMVETLFEGFNERPKYAPGFFSEANYISVSKTGKISVQKKYLNYKQTIAEDE